MSWHLTSDAAEFRDRAWAFLEQRRECNVLATVLIGALAGSYDDVRSLFACALDDAGEVTGAALRTPPFSMLATRLDPGAADGLLDQWLGEDPELPGANSDPATARALASGWRARTGGLPGAREAWPCTRWSGWWIRPGRRPGGCARVIGPSESG